MWIRIRNTAGNYLGDRKLTLTLKIVASSDFLRAGT
jgi:hypothetical protein